MHARARPVSLALPWLALPLLACSGSGSSGGPDASPKGDASAVDARRDGATDARDPRDVAVRDTGASDAPRASDATDGATGLVDAGFDAAAHALPLIPTHGGPVFSHPLLVTVTFADDPQRAFAEQLGEYLVTSPWLATVGAEYGVGSGSHVPVELTTRAPPTIDDTGIQALLESLVHAGTLPDTDAGASVPQLPAETDWGGVDAGGDAAIDAAIDAGGDAGGDAAVGGGSGSVRMPSIIYMFYFPSTTSVTAGGVAMCDFSGGGYHYQTAQSSSGQAFAYGVITECPGSTRDALVGAVSHEFIEAATDPSAADLAFSISDPNDPWSSFGGEVGDLCSFLAPQWAEGGFSGIQRVYSNRAAATGGDPCLPAPEPFFGTDVEPRTAVAIAAGATGTFQVTGWSTAPVAPWSVVAEAYTSDPSDFQPTFSLSTGQLGNGGAATLQVTVPAGSAPGSYALGLVLSMNGPGLTDYTSSLVEVYVP